MEQGSGSSAPNENGGGASSSVIPTLSTAARRPPSFLLNVQTHVVPSIPYFLRLIQQNLYQVLRILVTEVQFSRLRNFYYRLRASQVESLAKIRRAQARVTEAIEAYNSLKIVFDETFESVNLLWSDFLGTSIAWEAAKNDFLKAADRLLRLKRNLAILNHNSDVRSYRKLRLRQLIRKARLRVAKIEKKISKLDTLYRDKHETYRVANEEFQKAEKEFNDEHSLPYLEMRRLLEEASEEFNREHQIHEEQFNDLRRGLENLRRDHRMGILRTVPLLQLDRQQQETVVEAQAPPAPGTSGNIYEWQSLIFFRVDVVIEVKTVNREYYVS